MGRRLTDCAEGADSFDSFSGEDIYSCSIVHRETLGALVREALNGDPVAQATYQVCRATISSALEVECTCTACGCLFGAIEDVEAVLIAVPHDFAHPAISKLLCVTCGNEDWEAQRERLITMMRTMYPNVRVAHNVHRVAGHA